MWTTEEQLVENNNADGDHFIRFRDTNTVFKFLRLGVDVALIDLMHNDVRAFAARNVHSGSCTESRTNSIGRPEEENLNGSNADMSSDMAGPSSSGLGDLFELSDKS